MLLKTLFLPYDVYSRHKIVAKLTHRSGVILDVGGSLRELANFLPSHIALFSTDVIGGDVIFDGKNLPFKDRSFETVVSIDTMEHIPSCDRLEFLQELVRVAKKRVVVAAPLGTTAHVEAEKYELERQKKSGKPDHFLVEHVKYTLPNMEEIKQWVRPFPSHNILFQGNFRMAQYLFRLQQSTINVPKLGRLWYETKKLIFAIINLCVYPWDKDVCFSQSVNRFYLQINL